MEFKHIIRSIIHPIQASWTERSFLKRWPVEILKISKIGEMEMKNLNISMSSCADRSLFGLNASALSDLKFIPYKLHEQTAPSWSAGRLKSSKSAKSAKWKWKTWISPWVLVQIGICFDEIQALETLHNPSYTSVMNRPLFPESPVNWILQSAKKAKINRRTSTTPWVLDRFG